MIQYLKEFGLFLNRAVLCLLIINILRSSGSEMSPVLRPGVAFLPISKPFRILDKHWIIFSNFDLFSYEALLKKTSIIFTGFENILNELEKENQSIKRTEIPLTEVEKERLMADFYKDNKSIMESENDSKNDLLFVCRKDIDMPEMAKYFLSYKELQVKLQNYKYIIQQELESLSMHSDSLSNTKKTMEQIGMWVSVSKCPQNSDQNYLEHIFKSYLFGQETSFDVMNIKETVHHYDNLRATVINNDTLLETREIINQLENCLTILQNTDHLMSNYANRLIAAINGIETLIHSGVIKKLNNELNDLLMVVSNSAQGRNTKATSRYKDFLSNNLIMHLDNEKSYFTAIDLIETAKVELHRCNNFVIQVIILSIPKPEQYPLFKLLSTPISVPEGYLKFRTVPHYLVHINDTILELSESEWMYDCKSSANYYICPESPHILWVDQFNCIWKVYNIKKNALDLPPECETELVQSYHPLFKNINAKNKIIYSLPRKIRSYPPLFKNIVGKNKILYSLPRKTPFTIYCENKTRSLLMLNGTGYIVLPHKCELMLGSLFTTFSPEVWMSMYRNLSFYMSNPDISVIKRKYEVKTVLYDIEHQLQQLKSKHNTLRKSVPVVEMKYEYNLDFVYYWSILCILTIGLLLVVAFWPR